MRFEIMYYAVILFMLAVAGAGITVAHISAKNLGKCLELGYTYSKTTTNLDAYCIKRVDGTDVVIKL